MGNPKGFIEVGRENPALRNPLERITDFKTHYLEFSEDKRRQQASRCMECGVPFCMSGCPLGNMIPDFNDLVYRGRWDEALRTLHATNNFPEFTGMICPAPCENACVLGIINPAVNIKLDELSIIEHAFQENRVRPIQPEKSSGKSVAIIGSGPAGLACAQQLRRAGHAVTVYEKSPQPGGLLMYGIPEYKLPKAVVQRRVKIMKEEGIEFKTRTEVGRDISWAEIRDNYDAVVVAIGAETPRDLNVPGRDLEGVHFAMEFLPQQVSRLQNENLWSCNRDINATGKDVVVIGGGDTGSDCIGTSLRQGARSVINFEIMPKHPDQRSATNPWPQYARINRVSTSQEENKAKGGKTEYCIATKRFIGDDKGNLVAVETIRVEWEKDDKGAMVPREVEGSEETWDCQLALLAMGFTGPKTSTLTKDLKVKLNMRTNIQQKDDTMMTDEEGVFAAGDCRRGQSLVVWAIAEGREIARNVDSWLMNRPSRLAKVRLNPYLY